MNKMKTTKKSEPAKMVLQLMDKDYGYENALKMALSKYKIKRAKLEKELDNYI